MSRPSTAPGSAIKTDARSDYRNPANQRTHTRQATTRRSRGCLPTNRRLNGSRGQRYEHGVPVTDLEPVEADGTTGTCVRFLPEEALRSRWSLTAGDLARWPEHWPDLTVRLEDQCDGGDRSGR